MTNISNIVKQIRKRNNLTQSEFAESVGVSRSAIALIETSKNKPSIELAKKIATIFKVNDEEIEVLNNVGVNEVKNVELTNKQTNITNNNKKNVWRDENGNEINLPLNLNLINDTIDKELVLNYRRLSVLRNQILTISNYLKEKTEYHFSTKELEMLISIDEFLNDNSNGILRLTENGRLEYNNALKLYVLTSEEYLSMLIDYFKFIIDKPIKNFDDLKLLL